MRCIISAVSSSISGPLHRGFDGLSGWTLCARQSQQGLAPRRRFRPKLVLCRPIMRSLRRTFSATGRRRLCVHPSRSLAGNDCLKADIGVLPVPSLDRPIPLPRSARTPALNAGATPWMGRLDRLGGADFTAPWKRDVKAIRRRHSRRCKWRWMAGSLLARWPDERVIWGMSARRRFDMKVRIIALALIGAVSLAVFGASPSRNKTDTR